MLIPETHRETIQKYITGIITNRNCKAITLYCNPDHIHLLVGLHPDCSISSLIRDIKAGSTEFINKNKMLYGKFSWQNGYAAFSCSRSKLASVVAYIENQKEHHKCVQFQDEYEDFIRVHGVKNADEYMRGEFFNDSEMTE